MIGENWMVLEIPAVFVVHDVLTRLILVSLVDLLILAMSIALSRYV